MKEEILIGGYTRELNHDKGIYHAILDTEKEAISQPELLLKVGNPTYLTVSDKNILYTIKQVENQGGLGAYDLNNSPINDINDVLAAGSPPAYVALDQKRNFVYAANYHKGEVIVCKIKDDGGMEVSDIVTHHGKGPKPEQDSAHVHYTDLTSDQRLIVCDLGMDAVMTYDVSNEGKLQLISTYHTQPGFGPRHLIFNPTKSIVYLVGELASEVSVLKYDEQTGALSHIETYSLIPESWDKYNGSAAIRISSDGHFLYVSNRGHNSIDVFKISQNGLKLELIQRVSTDGDFPRDFNLDPSEDFLFVVHQKTNNGTLFKRNKSNGFLTQIQTGIETPEGTCVFFKK